MAETKDSSSWKLVNDLVQLIGLVAVLTGLWRATARVDRVEQRQDVADERQDKIETLQIEIMERVNERRKEKADSI